MFAMMINVILLGTCVHLPVVYNRAETCCKLFPRTRIEWIGVGLQVATAAWQDILSVVSFICGCSFTTHCHVELRLLSPIATFHFHTRTASSLSAQISFS